MILPAAGKAHARRAASWRIPARVLQPLQTVSVYAQLQWQVNDAPRSKHQEAQKYLQQVEALIQEDVLPFS
jgi:hypothetical protein